MSIAAIAPAAASFRAAAFHAAPQAPAQHIVRHVEIRSEPATEVAPVQTAAFAKAAAAQAAQALYDVRVTGPSDSVRSFDRIAMIEEGFAHLREIFEGAKAEAEAAFGGFKNAVQDIDEAMVAHRLDTRA